MIQFWSVVTSEAASRPPGGIGDDEFCMRDTESCASFFVGSSCAVAFKSE